MALKLKVWDSATYEQLTAPHASCELCPLYNEAPTTVGVPGVRCLDSQPPASTQPAFVVIGQNPGRHEDEQAVPFVGQTGSDLHRVILRFLGVKDEFTVYLLNAYRCFHQTGSPKPTYVTRCSPHLQRDLQSISDVHWETDHLFILCLGQPAWGSIARLLGLPAGLESYLFAHQGTPCPITRTTGATSRWWIFGTYHPAFIMRKRSAILAMQDHLRLLRDAIDGILPKPSSPRIISPRLPHRS